MQNYCLLTLFFPFPSISLFCKLLSQFKETSRIVVHFVESTNFIFQERQETYQKEADQEERRTTRQTNQGDYLKIVNKNNYYFKVHDDVFLHIPTSHTTCIQQVS